MLSTRSILHLDADAFFASVEQATDARLRGKPVAVGGQKRGIIASASYEARKFGVYTPMPTVQARRLCPRLIIVPGDFTKYEFFSRLMFSYAYDFTPDVEIGSIDEGYFDLTGARKPPVSIGETIRRAIRQSLKLTVSEGIGSNKLISHIASKLNKPFAFQLVPAGYEARFLSPLANRWLPGVGPKTATQLTAAGLARIGQIAHTPADLLGLLVGGMALQLRTFALGVDDRPVVPVRAAAKSYGEQQTFAADTTDQEFLEATLRRMADTLMARVREDAKAVRTVTVKVRYNDMDEEMASESLEEPTDLETEIYSMVAALLRKAWKRRVSLRLVSLKLSNVYDGRFRSALALDVLARKHEAQGRLASVVDDLRHRFGRSAVLRAHDFTLRDKKDRGEEPKPLPPPGAGQNSSLPHECGVPRPIGTPHSCGSTTSQKKFVLHPPPPHSPGGHQLHDSPTPYQLAVVQRQRLGHSAARQPPEGKARRIIHTSPAPELRFRTEMISPAASNKAGGDSHLQVRKFASSRAVTCIPLNVHSCYSFLNSTLSIGAIVGLARRHELPAIAITDKNNLHGAVEFAQTAAQAGIKPIIGAEVDWQGRRVCLYVENQKGYHNLCRILNTLRDTQPDEGRARSPLRAVQPSDSQNTATAPAFIFDSTEGLLAVSSQTELAQFFPNRFYLQITNPEAFNKSAAPLPCLASFPVHYESPGHRSKYDIVQSIRTLTLLRQAHPEKTLTGEYHFRSPSEMGRLFGAYPELLEHTVELADRCSFEFALGKPQFPGYQPADGSTPAAFLRRLVMDGLRRRYPKDHPRLKPQLEQELAIITDVGYEEYFLIMWDILQECRRRGIEWITRGSAADSLACYCLEISDVCPIRFDLYFRRFLNKDRMALNKLPDIDVDFAHDRKDDVIDLVFEKFGSKNTAVVGGFSTFQSRSAFAEVAKVLGVSDFQVRRFTERLPGFSRATELPEAVAGSQECRDLPFEEDPYHTALHMAHFLDGFPRYPKMHPCGLVLSRQPMDEIVPCFISAKGYPTTHFDMDSVEAVGLIKMDILAQGGLAVMRDVKEMVAREADGPLSPSEGERVGERGPFTRTRLISMAVHPGPLPKPYQCSAEGCIPLTPALSPRRGSRAPIDLAALEPWTDPKVWDLIANGHARAVHHIESPAMISLCKMCNVRDIDTLIAIVSVIRPGAANEHKKMEFARRYQGLSPVQYPHPSLEPCLRSTCGLVVYEEHILQICDAFAGLPAGRADILRRALAKDKPEIVDQIQIEFAECARRNGRLEPDIAKVWDLVSGFQGYAFCKAHSTAYGVEAYQSAWLKLNYPAEFMAAVLTNGKGFYDPLVYVLECHRLGISLLRPFVNEPGPQFTVTNGKIRVPVLQVKGLSQRTRESILQERVQGEFASLPDFFLRVQPLNEEMEAMIQAGAFDDFGQSRTHQYWEFKSLAANRVSVPRPNPSVAAKDSFKSRALGAPASLPATQPAGIAAPATSCFQPRQLWLFPPGNIERLPAVPLAEPSHLQRLRWEEELLGYPVSSHPLELYPDIAWDTYCPIDSLARHIGEQVVTCGLVIEQRLFHQVTGEPMKFLTIADRTGIVETELFARTYKSYGLNTVRYRVLEIVGTVEPFENGRGHTLRVQRAGKPRSKTTGKEFHAEARRGRKET